MLYTGQIVRLKSTDNIVGFNVNGKQVNILTAKKFYEAGKKIWLHTCNLSLYNAWQVPYHYQKSDTNTGSFESLINNFANYNHDKERGRRTIFFVECNKNGKISNK